MRLRLRYIARWLAWQLSELDHELEHPPARITVFSGARPTAGEQGAA
jgi:hypothetical protein